MKSLAIRRMATVHGECNPYCHDFEARRRHHQVGAEHPEECRDPQGHHTATRYIQPNCVGVTEQLRTRRQSMR